MSEELKEKKGTRYFVILIIALAGGFITKLPYIMGTYFSALEAATGLTRTQLGWLSSIYGIVNFVVYLPGGYLADKVSAKKLVVIGSIGTGLFGLWYALLPGFIWLLVIHMGFAITSVFIFWAAMVKAVNNLGTDAEQGKMFGFLEGSRYLIGILASYGSIYVFGRFADQIAGFKGVIVFYSVGVIVAGLLALFFYPKTAAPASAAKAEPLSPHLFLQVLKYPHIWMCGLIVFFNYITISLINYNSAYLVDFFGVDTGKAASLITTAGAISTVVGAYLGGWIADKIGSRVKFMAIACVGMTIFAVAEILIPQSPAMLMVFLVASVLFCFFAVCVKALYFSTIGDVKMPQNLAGSASAVISLIGYMPDMFIYLLAGSLFDTLGKSVGYKVDFSICAGASIIGLVCCLVLMRMIRKSTFSDTAAQG